MSIYVDSLFVSSAYHGGQKSQAAFVGARTGNQWCHMITDGDEEELHQLAEAIGMKRRWYQGDHYDLTPSKRKLAVARGAVEIDVRELVDILRRRRNEVAV